MLASVMPGLRELRAPLAAGYLWLALSWLVLGDALPASDEVNGPFARLYELEPVVSNLGLAVVASVGAYILGSIAIDVQVRIGQRLSGDRELGGITSVVPMTEAGWEVLNVLVRPIPPADRATIFPNRTTSRGVTPNAR
jgi:hypothetical protein